MEMMTFNEIMNDPGRLALFVAMTIFFFIVLLTAIRKIERFDSYAKQYPGAKLLDELAASGQLKDGDTEKIVKRLGKSKNLKAEVETIRSEYQNISASN